MNDHRGTQQAGAPVDKTMELETRFTYHPPKEGQPEKYVEIRETALDLALVLNDLCPESREKSLALTHLDEVVFFANAAIARRE